MVNTYDRLIHELKNSCIDLQPELIFSPQRYKDEFFFHIEIPSTSKFFRIGYPEYTFISLLDGKTSFAHALAVASQRLGASALTEEQATQTVHWLLENGLAVYADDALAYDAQRAEDEKSSLVKKLNPFWLKLPLGHPDAFIDALQPYCRWLFHPISVAFSLLIMLLACGTVTTHWDAFQASSTQIFARSNWIWMLVTWVGLKIVHELAHGLACNRYGGKVKETGIIFILLAPMAYIDVTSSWRLSSRWKRIAVASAGMYIELVIASICVIAWGFTSSELVAYHLFNVILMASVSTLLFNANPLMRFDAYFILSDLMKIPNLYASGSKAFHNAMRWLFFGQEPDNTCCELKNNRSFITGYGFCASFWKVLICIGLTISASVMFGGLGILIAGMGVVAWFAKPAVDLIRDILQRTRSRPHSVIRTAMVSSCLMLILAGSWFLLPNPFCSRNPCLVDYHQVAKVRSDSAGFIREVFVREGELVTQGDPLLRLENRNLISQIAQLEATLEQQITRERIAIDQAKPTHAQVERQNHRATSKTLLEKQRQLERLIVRAPTSGRVVARNIQQSIDTYVRPGDVLLSIGNESHKEIVLLIGGSDVRSADHLLNKTIPIEIGTRRTFLARITRIDPQASLHIDYPSLAAPNGGSLVVRPLNKNKSGSATDKQFELCDPRLRAVATIDLQTSERLFSGERGFAILESNSPTLGKWLWNSTHNWLSLQIQQAQLSH